MTGIGQRLVEAREARGLSLEEVERDTRISRRYLQALEAEQFDVIPAPVYARGFLRSYSQYVGLDPQEMLALFPRDDDGYGGQAQQPPRATPETPVSGVGASRPAWSRPKPGQQPPQQQQPGQPGQRSQLPPGAPPPAPPRPPDPFAGGRQHTQPQQPQQPQGQPFGGGQTPPPNAPPAMAPPPRSPQEHPQPHLRAVDTSTPNVDDGPIIGIDIGVPPPVPTRRPRPPQGPNPARRIPRDPSARGRSMTVIVVAVVAILGIALVAFLISSLGGDDDDDTTGVDPGTDQSQGTGAIPGASGDGGTDGGSSPGGSSGLDVTPGVVPDVTGQTAATARQAIQEAGFTVIELSDTSESVPVGAVINQAPAAGTEQGPAIPVNIIVSEGP